MIPRTPPKPREISLEEALAIKKAELRKLNSEYDVLNARVKERYDEIEKRGVRWNQERNKAKQNEMKPVERMILDQHLSNLENKSNAQPADLKKLHGLISDRKRVLQEIKGIEEQIQIREATKKSKKSNRNRLYAAKPRDQSSRDEKRHVAPLKHRKKGGC